jgi:hypothetical protein
MQLCHIISLPHVIVLSHVISWSGSVLFSKEISGASPSGIIPLEETTVCLGEQQMCMKQLICDEC